MTARCPPARAGGPDRTWKDGFRERCARRLLLRRRPPAQSGIVVGEDGLADGDLGGPEHGDPAGIWPSCREIGSPALALQGFGGLGNPIARRSRLSARGRAGDEVTDLLAERQVPASPSCVSLKRSRLPHRLGNPGPYESRSASRATSRPAESRRRAVSAATRPAVGISDQADRTRRIGGMKFVGDSRARRGITSVAGVPSGAGPAVTTRNV